MYTSEAHISVRNVKKKKKITMTMHISEAWHTRPSKEMSMATRNVKKKYKKNTTTMYIFEAWHTHPSQEMSMTSSQRSGNKPMTDDADCRPSEFEHTDSGPVRNDDDVYMYFSPELVRR